jgi:hypothetical protein
MSETNGNRFEFENEEFRFVSPARQGGMDKIQNPTPNAQVVWVIWNWSSEFIWGLEIWILDFCSPTENEVSSKHNRFAEAQ